MGFLGFGNYSKPGKGVSKNAPEKKRFFVFWEILFRKFWKIMQVNLLYVLFFIPMVLSFVLLISWGTASAFNMVISIIACVASAAIIGVATAGVVYIMRAYAREQHSFLLSDFIDTVKGNWKQASITGVIMALAGIIIYYSSSFYYLNIGTSYLFVALFGISMLLALLFLFISFYIYLLMVTIDLKLFLLFKNALILSILGLKSNFITLFFLALIVIPTILFFPISIIVIVLIVPALIQLIICYNSFQYIKKFCIDPYYAANQNDEDGEKTDSVFSDDITLTE